MPASKRYISVVIGTNDLGDLKRFHAPGSWDGGMLAVWNTGGIWLSVPHRRVGALSTPLKATDFMAWLKTHGIHIDKIYGGYENQFADDLRRIQRAEEDGAVAALLVQFQQALEQKCVACGAKATDTFMGKPVCGSCGKVKMDRYDHN